MIASLTFYLSSLSFFLTDATFQYLITDQKFIKDISPLLLEPSRPSFMRRSSSLNFLGPPSSDLSLQYSKPLRVRTTSLSYQKEQTKVDLRKRPSERNLNEIEEIRNLEWSYRKQDIDFPSCSINTLVAVSPKGKRCDSYFVENSELLCRSISGVLKGYIETATQTGNDERQLTPRGHRFNIFERSSPSSPFASPSSSSSHTPTHHSHHPTVEFLDLSKIMNPASQILEKRKFKKCSEPSVDEIFRFIHNIYLQTQMETECLIMALVYIERAVYGVTSENVMTSETSSTSSTPPPCRTPSPSILSDRASPSSPSCQTIETLTLSTSNWKAVVITALLLASKIWDDFSMVNSDFADICFLSGCMIDVQRLNELEKSFLVALDYRVFVKGPEYSQVYFRLQSIMDRLRGWLTDKNNQGKRQRQSNSPYQQPPRAPSQFTNITNSTPNENRILNQKSMSPPSSTMNTNQTLVVKEIESNLSQSISPSFVEPQPVQLGTLLSRNLFNSIYSWIDDQLFVPSPQSTSPSKNSAGGEINDLPPSPLHRVPSSDQSPFVSKPRRRAYSTPATVHPASLPPPLSLSTSLSESVSTSDLFGSMVLADSDFCHQDDTPISLECVTDIFEKSVRQYQRATELTDLSEVGAEFL
jgi:hypothetical protein